MNYEKEIYKTCSKKLTEIDKKLDTALHELSDHEKRLRVLEGTSGKR